MVDDLALAADFRSFGAANPELIVLVKIHREARYEPMVDMMDLLEEAHMERFSLIPMKDADVQALVVVEHDQVAQHDRVDGRDVPVNGARERRSCRGAEAPPCRGREARWA